MLLTKKQAQVFTLAALVFASPTIANAEVPLAKAGGWTFSTDGRVNGFLSHVWGDNRPEGLENLAWVGFNEITQGEAADKEGKLRTTRIRSGYVPSVLGFNLKKLQDGGLNVHARVELGIQISNTTPAGIPNQTWMDPRQVYLDVGGNWGTVRVGRDFRLFSRGNLFMNYELGHAYGVGFPCSYQKIFGGACGHVGFGTLWPDFTGQITYITPNFGDVFQVSVGAFDPRTVETLNWFRIPIPRFETEAIAKYDFRPGWGFKAWVNGAWQQVGLSYDVEDPTTMEVIRREDELNTVYGVGGGAIGYFGPIKAGVSGYMGKGMDGFEFLTFNPIISSRDSFNGQEQYEIRPARGYLAEASVTFGSTWVMGGYGRAELDRMDTDVPIVPRPGVPTDINAAPLLRSQTGISAGVFHRIEHVVFGIDYFNAHYGFDPRFVDEDPNDGLNNGAYVEPKQTVNIVNAGATLEW